MRCEVFSAGVHMPSDIKAFKISHTSEWKLDILSPGVLPAPYCFVCPAAPQGQSKSCSHQRPEVKAYSWLQLWASTDSKQMPGQKKSNQPTKTKKPQPCFPWELYYDNNPHKNSTVLGNYKPRTCRRHFFIL